MNPIDLIPIDPSILESKFDDFQLHMCLKFIDFLVNLGSDRAPELRLWTMRYLRTRDLRISKGPWRPNPRFLSTPPVVDCGMP